jgi:hypothetical protein
MKGRTSKLGPSFEELRASRNIAASVGEILVMTIRLGKEGLGDAANQVCHCIGIV